MIDKSQIAVAGNAMPTTRANKLRVVVDQIDLTNRVYCRVRQILPFGEVVSSLYEIDYSNTLGAQAKVIDLTDGYLLDVSIWEASFPSRIGQIFASVWFQDGSTFNASQALLLTSGYLAGGKPLRWPYDTPQGTNQIQMEPVLEQTAAPAAGNDWGFSPNINAKVQLQGGRFSLDTSVAVANRRSGITVSTASTIIYRSVARTAQPASTSWEYILWLGSALPDDVAPTIFIPLPEIGPLIEMDIASFSTNLQAADQYSQADLCFNQHATTS